MTREQLAAQTYAEKIIPELVRDMRNATSGEQLRVLSQAVQRGYIQGRIDGAKQRGSV